MEREQSYGGNAFRTGRWRVLCATALSFLFALVISGTAFAQNVAVTGTVTSTGGTPLPGVTVRVQGTDSRTITDASGKYRITAPSDAVLTFSLVGQRPVQTTVAGRSTVDVTMAQVPYLEEVVVTAYTEQRRGDITGAVSSVNVEQATKQTQSSVLKAMDATVPGVTVATSGAPGARNTVRIRGISSFQNNDPLYVVDGTPVSDSYLNFLNPNDITSIQVLKDASAASIYGARAGNGVVLIETTKRGITGAPQTTLRVRTGIQTPVRGLDDMVITNSLDYFQIIKTSYDNAGQPLPPAQLAIWGDPNNPSVPLYTYASPNTVLTRDQYGRPLTVDLNQYSYPNSLIEPGSAGTNWWKAVWGSAPVQDFNLDVRGGSDANAYTVSGNYFNQKGTAAYTNYRRGSLRANTSFTRGKFTFGENAALTLARQYGGSGTFDDTNGEGGVLGKDILTQPVVSVYDVAGNFGGARGVPGVNNTNPLQVAFAQKDNTTKFGSTFGNAFASYDLLPALTVKTNLGFDLRQNNWSGFNDITPQNNEANFTNSIYEGDYNQYNWSWSNTARYLKSLGRSSVDLLVGQEASGGQFRQVDASMASLLNSNLDSRYVQDALGDPSTKNVSSFGGKSALLSVFGKLGYNFADKYVASYTLRRDGSSNLAPGHRWGTFPAFGLGWHISNEPFLSGNRFLSDLMLRYGWGITGNQNIPSGRVVSTYGGDRGDTFYDITGSNQSIVAGFRQAAQGNPDLKWEENKSSNIGADAVLFNGMFNVVLDVYTRRTDNLLFDPRTPATAGIANPPIVNIGKMENKGFEFSIGHTASWWNVAFNGSHYKNKIVSIDGVQDYFFGPNPLREGQAVINQIGHPIGSFYGLVMDGYFRDQADATAHLAAGNCGVGGSFSGIPCQDGAAPGRIKFKDINGDGVVDANDRTVIGSPHPNFTMGIDLGAHRGNWDASATIFGTYGNKIFDNQMDFYVFRDFETTVLKDRLSASWSPTNQNAKYPILDLNDSYSGVPSSFYVQDGSYTRLRNLQIGYTLPGGARYLPGARIYVQGDNLWTHTNYEGLDPAIPPGNQTGAAGDIRDQFMGVDRGSYPTNKVFSIGITTSF
ncbi:MAG TPA: SusC/RagA family TonB-linked outer membrane protein [Gemmatimonadaceae bacterium]|nr:SusC/RagA family TonB-linked outer membrane protein [Gemmatimonadaceae bacterium]